MATKHQKKRISIGEGYTQEQRQDIADDIIDVIIARSKSGKGVRDGKKISLPKYTDAYAKRKGQRNVDLTLDDDMLNSIELIKDGPTTVTIGFRDGSKENAKADGNIRGTYGKQRANRKKARPFLGVTQAELNKVLRDFQEEIIEDDEG